jgi:hypothetical protein
MLTRSKAILFHNPITSDVTQSNLITSGITVSNGNEHENVNESVDEKDDVDITFDGDELIQRLDILMEKAESDLERSKYLLGKVEDYHKICTKTVKHLKICRSSFVKVIKYSYQMKIRNADYEIDYMLHLLVMLHQLILLMLLMLLLLLQLLALMLLLLLLQLKNVKRHRNTCVTIYNK